MSVPANTTNVMIDTALPVTPVVLQLGDGTTRSITGKRVFAGTAVTDGSGNAVFTFTPAFAAVPVVSSDIQAAAGFRSTSITALSASSCTVFCQQSTGVTILGIGVLAAGTPAAGVTVHLIATDAGQV